MSEAEPADTGSVGRFSSYRGLRPVLAIRQVTPAVGIAAGRVLRRWYRSKDFTKQVTMQRIEQSTGRCSLPAPANANGSSLQPRLRHLHDGPDFTSQLARYLSCTEPLTRVTTAGATDTTATKLRLARTRRPGPPAVLFPPLCETSTAPVRSIPRRTGRSRSVSVVAVLLSEGPSGSVPATSV